MTWWLRFALWATVLFPVAWLCLDAWHAMLVPCVSFGLSCLGFDFEVLQIDLLAPYDVSFFFAMVLATSEAPRADRIQAAGVGLLGLFLSEIVFATLGTWVTLREEIGRPLPAVVSFGREAMAASLAWVMAPLMWLALLGRHAPWLVAPDGRSRRALASPVKDRRRT